MTPWYPSEQDAMSGLFVQKHVEAVHAQGCDVRVIFAQSWRDTWRQWKALQREGWMPNVVQLNVIQKQGLLALWLKKRYGIPYVIIEHWTGYLPDNQHVSFKGWHTRMMKKICREAEVVMPVSQPLMEAMQSLGFKAKRWTMIDNVVDDFFFDHTHRKTTKDGRKILLNITCFDEPHKNVKGLLRAAKALSEERQDWQLVIVGTGVDYQEVRSFADTLHIPEGLLRWTGELPPQAVADEFHRADAFALSSRYETYGVVLAEAAAAGVPILSTPVGIAEEIADLIVPQEMAQHDPQGFAEYIKQILWGDIASSHNKQSNKRFTTEQIGAQLKQIYESCLK